MKNRHKGFIVPAIIVAVIVIAGAVAYFGFRSKGPIPASASSLMTDDQKIQATVNGLLTDSKSVKTPADVLKVVQTYYTPVAVARFQSVAATIAPGSSAGDTMVKEMQSLPDSSLLTYVSSDITASSTAVATYRFKQGTQVNLNGASKPGQQGSLAVDLEKDNGAWLIGDMKFSLE